MFRPRTTAGYTTSEEELHRLRQEFFVKFHNISRVMDCVGCEKCRLWGKLQTLGLGTAIKIVLGQPEDRTGEGGRFEFQRNEVIALINTAHQLAKSVKAVDDFHKLEFDEIVVHWLWLAGVALIAGGLLLGLARRLSRSRAQQGQGQGQGKEKKEAAAGKPSSRSPSRAPAAAAGSSSNSSRKSKKA
jgi:ERO1-like protein alpha